jgi:hypothetical protein
VEKKGERIIPMGTPWQRAKIDKNHIKNINYLPQRQTACLPVPVNKFLSCIYHGSKLTYCKGDESVQ